jgi:hypothetical protein
LQDRVSEIAQRALVIGIGRGGVMLAGEGIEPILEPGQELVDKRAVFRPAEVARDLSR